MRNAYTRSVLFDVFLEGWTLEEHERGRPALMSLSSLYQDMAKYSNVRNPILIDEDAWTRTWEILEEMYDGVKGRCTLGSYWDAVMDFALNTSSTYEGRRAGPTKAHVLADFFDHGEDSQLVKIIQEANRAFLDDDITDWGETTQAYSKVAGKTEIRSEEKAGKTRAFIVPPLSAYLLEHFLFAHQCKLMREVNVLKGIRAQPASCNVGVPVQHRGYDHIIRRMLTFDHHYSMDTTAHDGGVKEFEMAAVAAFRFKLLHPRYRTAQVWRAIERVYHQVQHGTCVLPDGSLARRVGGQPSGRFLTLDDNCLITSAREIYAWVRMVGLANATSESFHSSVFLNIMGDDAHVSTIYDPQAFKQWLSHLREFGIVVDAQPSDVFCKHSIAFDEAADCYYFSYPGGTSLGANGWLNTRNFEPLVQAYLTAAGHLSMARDPRIVAHDPEGRPHTIREVLNAFLDHLEATLVDGVPFIDHQSFDVVRGCRLADEDVDRMYTVYA